MMPATLDFEMSDEESIGASSTSSLFDTAPVFNKHMFGTPFATPTASPRDHFSPARTSSLPKLSLPCTPPSTPESPPLLAPRQRTRSDRAVRTSSTLTPRIKPTRRWASESRLESSGSHGDLGGLEDLDSSIESKRFLPPIIVNNFYVSA